MRASLGVLLGVIVTSCTCGPPKPAARDPLVEELASFRARATRVDRVRFEGGFPTVISGRVPVEGATVLERAKRYLEQNAGLYGQGEGLALDVRRYDPAEASGLVVFHQALGGVPVWGAELVVKLAGPEVRGTYGRLLTTRQHVDLAPSLSAGQAVQRARALTASSAAPLLAPPTLVVFDPALLDPRAASAPMLGWRLALGTTLVLIDAHTGQLARSLDLRHPVVDPTMRFVVGAWKNSSAGPTVTWVETEAGSIPGTNDFDGVSLALHLSRTWDWYFKELDWSGPDGDWDPGSLEAVFGFVHENFIAAPGDKPNAWAVAEDVHFWDSFIGIDVVAHEFTHLVIGHGSNLVYADEPGALNEAYADLFGVFVEGFGWRMGDSAPVGAFRDLETPSLFKQPERYKQFQPLADDHGGVHTNSGIVNRLHVLLAEGGTFEELTVPPIGKEKVKRLAFAAVRELPSNASMFVAAEYYRATLRSWAESGQHGFTRYDACAADYALVAVDLLNRPLLDHDCDGLPDGVEADDDGDGVNDEADDCRFVSNPSQADLDKDGLGDACDDDLDGDQVPNDEDNCELPNLSQADKDHDGIGDACQDPDGDGVIASADNCPTDANPGQADTDGNGSGDACDPDRDGDGLFGGLDNCPFVANADQADDDGDHLGNACDPCTGVSTPGAAWSAGLPALGLDPAPLLPDQDGDGVPDACDDHPLRGGRVQVGGRPFSSSDLLPGTSGTTLDVVFDAVADGQRVVALPLPRCPGACPAPGHDDVVRLTLRGVPAEVSVGVLDDEGGGVASGVRNGGDVIVRFTPRGGRDYQLLLRGQGGVASATVTVSSARGTTLAPVARQPCAGAADGMPCLLPTGTKGLCLAGACGLARCGDGWVVAGEACDDGNDVSQDGCEPVSCTFSCASAADCDDGAPCNGVESCVSHRCVAGTAPSASLACTLPGGAAGSCRSGACASASCGNGAVDPGEACDDGNLVEGDGCDNGCVFSCTSTASCDDGNTCNGAESCTLATHTCAPGQQRSCADADACTADRCDALLGCVSTLVDTDGDGAAPRALGTCGRDCDDTRADVSPTAPEVCDGVDNDCDGQVDEGVKVSCVRDVDGDGFGAGAEVQGCACGPGFVPAPPARALDCLDGTAAGASVFPGQLTSFSQAYCAAPPCTAPANYDYDCDGVATPRWPALAATCTLSRGTCTGSGWTRGVPACGAAGVYQSCTLSVLGSCTTTTVTRTQECR